MHRNEERILDKIATLFRISRSITLRRQNEIFFFYQSRKHVSLWTSSVDV